MLSYGSDKYVFISAFLHVVAIADTVSAEDFKIIVASMIGRQPHEILLKRQGERPFKDQLTLQDYGVSNNVQLDLEVDTGD